MNIKTRCLLCLFVCCFVFGLYAQQDGEKTKIVHDLSKGKFEIKSFDAQSRKAEESAIYFEVENKKTNAGRIILDLSTLNQEDVTIAWQNYCNTDYPIHLNGKTLQTLVLVHTSSIPVKEP